MKNKKKYSANIAMLTILLILSGCASYRATSLSTLEQDIIISAPHEEVAIAAKAFSRSDCKRYLDRDVISKGYQPVQLYIKNNSDKNYVFSVNRVSLPCAHSEEVAEKVHTSTVGRAVGYGAGALLFWPLAIPAVIDGVKSAEANEALDMDFSSKAARDRVIAPFSHMNVLLFVPSMDFQSNFTVTLVEEPSKTPITMTVVAR